MSEILDHLPKQRRKKNTKALLAYGAMAVCVIFAGWYIGNILFGVRGLDVMLDLHAKREQLSKQVSDLQQENAKLQKDYFELIGLDPERN